MTTLKEDGWLAWNTGSNFYRHGKYEYRFDRDNGPFGLIRPRGAGIWKICVRRLKEGEEVKPLDERIKILDQINRLSTQDLLSEANVNANCRKQRARQVLFIEHLCKLGIPPHMPDDFEQLCEQRPPGHWSTKHRFEIETGCTFTPDGELANYDGSPHLGNRTFTQNKHLAARHKARQMLAKDGTPLKMGAWNEQMEAHLQWVLANKQASVAEKKEHAKRLEVSLKTLQAWEHHPEFQAKMHEAVVNLMSNPLLIHDLATTLQRGARDGDVQSAKLLLDLKNKIVPFQPHSLIDETSTIGSMTEQERDELIAESGVSFHEIVTGKINE